MAITTAQGCKIVGVSAAVSNSWMPTDAYTDVLGEKVIKSFKKSSGVEGRYHVVEHQTSGDLCFAAAQGLMKANNILPEDIGALVLVTQSPDYGEPCTACVLQHRLGLSTECVSFDVTLGCSGYPYGLTIAASLLNCSNMPYALLLAGDAISGLKKPEVGQEESEGANSMSLLLGDAGTATLLKKVSPDETEPLISICRTDGWGFRATGSCRRGYRHPNCAAETAAFMSDLDVFNYIIDNAPKIMNDYFDLMGTSIADYDCIALHQASKFTLKQVAKRLDCDMEKIPLSLTRYGNTGPASVPMTIVAAYGEQKADRDINFLMCGFGVGLSIGVTSAKININGILPVIHTDEWFNDGLLENKIV